MRTGWLNRNVAVAAMLAVALAGGVTLDLAILARETQPPEWAEEQASGPQSVLPLCAAAPNATPEQVALCAGYLKAIAHVLARNTVDGARACIPRATTLGALRDATVAYAVRNPDQVRRLKTDTLVARALAAAFPCP